MELQEKQNILYKMIEIRAFEEKVSKLRYDGDIYGAVHCCIGQEAVSVGSCLALQKSDYIMGTHRSHGFFLAKGGSMNAMMAEIFGKSQGVSGGRGGSMHLCDVDAGVIGTTGIVGSGLPVACGFAFAAKYNKEKKVTLVSFGDGACNEGTFHESLNLASVWKLPVIFLLENNGLAVTTLNATTTSMTDLYKRANGYDILSYQVNGQDVEEVFHTVTEAAAYARNGNGPVLIEAVTHRFHEHAEGKGYLRMKGVGYRDEDLNTRWINEDDPIKNYFVKLQQQGDITTEEYENMEKEALKKVEYAMEYAMNSPLPDIDTASAYVYHEEEKA